jgi:hypothetical protein
MIRVPVFSDFFEYAVDATQRSLLFWDTLRERGNEYLRHEAAGKPPLLTFGHEMLLDGRTLEKPCNYALLRILPGDGDLPTDPALRPFVVVDPRAGRGALPGVGARAPPGCPGRSLCHRQLSGGMGYHGSGRRAARAARPDPDRRLPPVLLGRCAGPEPDGGLLGGSWLTHLVSDLGNGRFDGANFVLNFEALNPANT